MKQRLILTLSLLLCLSAFGQTHKLGWVSGPYDKTLKQFVHHPAFNTASIKPKTDLRTADMPAIYDQGQLGSCTANAGLGAFEFAYHQKHSQFMLGSRLGLYYDERAHDGNASQDAGSTTGSILFVLAGGGVGTEKAWPYDIDLFAKKPPAVYYAGAKTFTTATTYAVDNTDHVSIRIALSNGLPVIFGGYVYQAIENLTASNYFLPLPSGRPIGGHEQLIVGHDDTLKHKYPNGTTITGFYLIRNSWGAGYASAGYYYAPKSYIENGRINEDCAVISLTK